MPYKYRSRRELIRLGGLSTILVLFLCQGLLEAQVDYLSKSGVAEIANLPSQPLGPGDLINVVVYGIPNMSRPIRVGKDGNISLPMLDVPIKAEGLIPDKLESTIADAFKAADILVDPVITVTVIEYQSFPVTVSGAVKKPLTFQAVGPVRLLDAIARADGLSPDAGSEILITSAASNGSSGSSTDAEQRINVRELLSGSSPSLNVLLHGGDQIRIPEAGKVFVVGNVHKPGAYRVENPADTSLLKMLALSEGLTAYATKTAYVYRREGSGSNKTEIAVPLQKIMERKESDFPLRADDILYVPDDKHKRLTANVLDRIVSFGAGTASGVLIWK
jgi:polysaccharide export outer membrane protein